MANYARRTSLSTMDFFRIWAWRLVFRVARGLHQLAPHVALTQRYAWAFPVVWLVSVAAGVAWRMSA